jgi:hypothetical protein
MLWTMGVLMVDRRDKFQRWYDLTERVIANSPGHAGAFCGAPLTAATGGAPRGGRPA